MKMVLFRDFGIRCGRLFSLGLLMLMGAFQVSLAIEQQGN
jgi:hypothetical protein